MEKVRFIDSHCHLSFKKFLQSNKDVNDDRYDIKNIIQRASIANVSHILSIGTRLDDVDETREIVSTYKNVWRTVGIHALEVDFHYENYSLDEISKIILQNCDKKDVHHAIGIGEIGLDYYYGKENIDKQKELFDLQLHLAKKCDLPVCVHSRNAEEDTIKMLKKHPDVKGVIHCFSGSKEFAYKALDLGFYISISGIVTFPKAQSLQEVVKDIPIDNLLIETDAPFLAPVPKRGKTNEPAFMIHTAEKISELLEISIDIVAEKTRKNFIDLFNVYI